MANKTVELKVLVDPDVRTQIDKVRGLVPMSAWLRDAVLSKLESIRDARNEMLERLNCTQCGHPYSDPACGPTHAMIAHEKQLSQLP